MAGSTITKITKTNKLLNLNLLRNYLNRYSILKLTIMKPCLNKKLIYSFNKLMRVRYRRSFFLNNNITINETNNKAKNIPPHHISTFCQSGKTFSRISVLV